MLDDSLNGTAGGRNTINAAAVSGDTSINLATGVATLGGAALAIRHPNSMQNLVSGDGNDTLAAGLADSLLYGGRGQNRLIGGVGKEIFVVRQRAGGRDTIVNFDAARGEIINLVGCIGKQFSDLVLTQQGADVKLDLGEDQHIFLKDQQVSELGEGHFRFQDTFSAPKAYINSHILAENPSDSVGTVVLNGGSKGVSYTTGANGQLIASLVGTVYSHDSAASDVFVVSKQTGVSNYRNALRGFKHGIDKIALSQTGITHFSELNITKRQRATINGLSQIQGVEVATTALDPTGKEVALLYLDALNVSQLSADDFIFSQPGMMTNPAAEGPPPPIEIPQIAAPITDTPRFVLPLIDTSLGARRDSLDVGIPRMRRENTAYQMVSADRPWRSDSLSSLFSLTMRKQPMTYTAVLADGTSLPKWLALDPKKGILTGTPDADTAATVSLKITATDETGFSANSMLELQAYPNILEVNGFQTTSVLDDQVAINAKNSFSTVTAAGGDHVLFMNGSMSSASLLGDGKNRVTVTGGVMRSRSVMEIMKSGLQGLALYWSLGTVTMWSIPLVVMPRSL